MTGNLPEILAQNELACGCVYLPSFQQNFFPEVLWFRGYEPMFGLLPFFTMPPFDLQAASALSE